MGTSGFGFVRTARRGTARRIIVLGRQGSGKGTQCDALARRLAVRHVSAGDALRRAVRTGSPIGSAVEAIMEAGELVDDNLVLEAIWDHIGDEAPSGFVLDGFPRTVEQAKLLDDRLGTGGIDLAIRLAVPVEEVVSRLSRRRVCTVCGLDHPGAEPGATCDRCGNQVAPRADDNPTAIRARLALYDRNETALTSWLSRHTDLISVDGDSTPEAVAGRMWAAVKSHPSALVPVNSHAHATGSRFADVAVGLSAG